MSSSNYKFFVWTAIAGVLFLIVGFHDVFVLTKSGFMICLEFVAGLGFLLNAFLAFIKVRFLN